MTGLRLIRVADLQATSWKNGGGETREIAVAPAGAGLEAFDWRVSMASVAADGPFSSFPGVDRTLTVLKGEGLRLSVTGLPTRELRPGDAPWSFPADVPTSAVCLGGPVTDLNVMTRRGRGRHRVRVADAGERVRADGVPTLVVCLGGEIRIGDGAEAILARRHDTAVFDRAPGLLHLTGPALVIEILDPGAEPSAHPDRADPGRT